MERKNKLRLGFKFNYFVLSIVVVFSVSLSQTSYAARDGGDQGNIAREWVAVWGDKWMKNFHKDIDLQMPGGRSNYYHDQYIKEAMNRSAGTGWVGWTMTNKSYTYEGDWFAVEWFYQATQGSTGVVQVESTVAFGRIQDDRLIVWIEYFDDMVGHYQNISAMSLYDKDNEEPFPWPEKVALKRSYRP